MARLPEAPRYLVLVLVAAYYIHYSSSEIRIPCPSIRRDYYPTKPQNSPAPYFLNITEDGGAIFGDMRELHYGPSQTYTISLNGTWNSGNTRETFVGFAINVYNEFQDEESGHFVTPPPQGSVITICHHDARSYFNEVVRNSTDGMEWSSFQVKWKSPRKYPAGKIVISAGVVKEHGVYWDGITLTLNYFCPMPSCDLPYGCPRGLAKSKFGCTLCKCAGGASVTASFTSLALILFALVYNLMAQ